MEKAVVPGHAAHLPLAHAGAPHGSGYHGTRCCSHTKPSLPQGFLLSSALPVTAGTSSLLDLRARGAIGRSEGPIKANHHFISFLKCSHH